MRAVPRPGRDRSAQQADEMRRAGVNEAGAELEAVDHLGRQRPLQRAALAGDDPVDRRDRAGGDEQLGRQALVLERDRSQDLVGRRQLDLGVDVAAEPVLVAEPGAVQRDEDVLQPGL